MWRKTITTADGKKISVTKRAGGFFHACDATGIQSGMTLTWKELCRYAEIMRSKPFDYYWHAHKEVTAK